MTMLVKKKMWSMRVASTPATTPKDAKITLAASAVTMRRSGCFAGSLASGIARANVPAPTNSPRTTPPRT
jgi:hypothetical protein